MVIWENLKGGGILLFYFIFGVAVLGILVVFLKKENEPARIERYRKEFHDQFNETLAISQTNLVNKEYVHLLNVALDKDFMEKVNTEFRLKFPRISQKQTNDYWRELKRYFLMAGVFKKVEMFNEKVDILWHIMLKHEKEYEAFCRQFTGNKINHIAHSQPIFKPLERTYFDFCYVQMFTIDSVALKVWGKFFKHDKGKEYLQEFEKVQLKNLKGKYMRIPISPIAETTFEAFTNRFKNYNSEKSPFWQDKYKQTNDVSYGYFVYAGSDTDDHLFKDMFGHNSADSSGSYSSHDSHSQNDGGDGGSSSCSSCSSCSSS